MLAAVLQASSITKSSNTVFEVVAKNTVYGQWRCARKPSFGTGCICCLLPTFGWRLACGQCLLLSALSGPWWVAQLRSGLSPNLFLAHLCCARTQRQTFCVSTKIHDASQRRFLPFVCRAAIFKWRIHSWRTLLSVHMVSGMIDHSPTPMPILLENGPGRARQTPKPAGQLRRSLVKPLPCPSQRSRFQWMSAALS